jgi:hypothetical protein
MFKGRPQLAVPFHLPAPLGGVNKVAPATLLPDMDAMMLVNMVASENGLRPRYGYRVWCAGLGAEVRSVFGYTGATGNSDKLFAATQDGLYDVTATKLAGPWTKALAFANAGSDAGYGTSVTFVTTADRFSVYCDEANGYFIRGETAAQWVPVVQKGATGWQSNHLYGVGDRIVETVNTVGVTFVCTTAGTSHGSVEPTWALEETINDNGVVWSYRQSVQNVDPAPGVPAPNPALFVHVCSFKERLIFVEKDSTRAWAAETGSLSGNMTELEFGRSFKTGGKLAGLYVWTMDGAQGTDDILVAVSTAGDVAWFTGTDPTAAWGSANGVKRVGTAFVGGVPAGRRLASAYGGDLLLLTTIGILPMSSLVAGKQLLAPDTYATHKIRPMYVKEMAERRSLRGWSLIPHPDSYLMVQIPTVVGEASRQMTMSMSTKGWSTFSGLPITHGCVWQGRLYFGTYDGRLCVNDVDEDNGDPISWSGLTRYSDMGAPVQKQVHLIRPIFLIQGVNPTCRASARYNFDMALVPTPTGAADPATGWDVAEWSTGEADTNPKAGVWAEVPTSAGFTRVTGTYGMGQHVAIAWAGSSRAPVSLAGFDLSVERGGML